LGRAHLLPGLRFLVTILAFIVPQLDWVTVGTRQARGDWQTEWDQTLQAARKEGRVVLNVARRYDRIFQEFQKKYPKIKVVTIGGRGSQIAERVMAERRAGKYLSDIYLSGSGMPYNVFYRRKALDPVKEALILPEVLDKSKWWGGKHFYHDDESKYILAFNGAPSPTLRIIRKSWIQGRSRLTGTFSIQSGRERSSVLIPPWEVP